MSERINLGKLQNPPIEIPNLIGVQLDSYKSFLQKDVPAGERKNQGLQEILNEFFPIDIDYGTDKDKQIYLELLDYDFAPVKKGIVDCLKDGDTYSSSLHIKFRLTQVYRDPDTNTLERDTKESSLFLGELPMMTPSGSFVINGAERVIICQLHRSPGICFEKAKHSTGKYLYSYRIIPDRGNWMEVQFDINNLIYIYLDRRHRRKKFLISTFLRAVGYESDRDMLSAAYGQDSIRKMSPKKLLNLPENENISDYYTFDSVYSPTGELVLDPYVQLTDNFVNVLSENDVKSVELVYIPNGMNYLITCLQKDSFTSRDEALKEIYRRMRPTDQPTIKNSQALLEHLFFDPRRYDLGRVGRKKLNERFRPDYEKNIKNALITANGLLNDLLQKIGSTSKKSAAQVDPRLKTLSDYLNSALDFIAQGKVVEDSQPVQDFPRNYEELNEFLRKRCGCRDKALPPALDVLNAMCQLPKHNSGIKEILSNTIDALKELDHCLSVGFDRILFKEDMMNATQILMNLAVFSAETDDIDHLGVRRVRTVGELLQNEVRRGFLHLEHSIRERVTMLGRGERIDLTKLVNPKPFMGVVRDFFARSQLSQFMDQVNPLAELTNKRRLSALGPGGLSRDRAGFEVRDVHPSHYGRICPIETPEGPNIGLISSLSLYASLNRYGFLETPYRKVIDGKVTNEIVRLSADQEENFVIAQANAPLNDDMSFRNPLVMGRYKGDSGEFRRENVSLMDVSPKQMVSAAAGLIPFLEHDDANRALMGANMQRQAVPLLTTESPYVGTGLEARVAKDSCTVVLAEKDGIVSEVSSDKVVITSDGLPLDSTEDAKPDVHQLVKYLRSNAGTSVNQRPVVRSGMHVRKGDIIADGAATSGGELSLGKNVLVAYMPWCGYNFEDAIVLSERMVKEDVYTSVHVEEFEIICRDTKLGPEEITCDIPNVGEEDRRHLDTRGVVRLGAEVKPGDILVGKITPKSETELAPVERLLKTIFGDKAADVKNSSLIVPSGKSGIVIDVRVHYKEEVQDSQQSKNEQRKRQKDAKNKFKNDYETLLNELIEKLKVKFDGVKFTLPVYTDSTCKEVAVKPDRKINKSSIKNLAKSYSSYYTEDLNVKAAIDEVMQSFKARFADLERDRNVVQRQTEEGIYNGPIERVKVYVACKHKIQVGDKMAGRHGNKGIVSRIVPVEDMPYLKDGTPVDIVLNPLGVPSRMNIGQVLETHLGWAASMLGMKVATPVFDGVDEKTIVDMMIKGNQAVREKTGEDFKWGFKTVDGVDVFDGKTDVYDGRTGNKFDQRVTVGQVYMLKLDHLVAHKIHARSVGPYSLVTQQPLGGKAQHGGQRFGEMEVWALEAYGAAYTLLEMLTVKSDDVQGRARIYESIVRGKNVLEPGRPESFNVLLKEMQSLGLDVCTLNRSELPKSE